MSDHIYFSMHSVSFWFGQWETKQRSGTFITSRNYSLLNSHIKTPKPNLYIRCSNCYIQGRYDVLLVQSRELMHTGSLMPPWVTVSLLQWSMKKVIKTVNLFIHVRHYEVKNWFFLGRNYFCSDLMPFLHFSLKLFFY